MKTGHTQLNTGFGAQRTPHGSNGIGKGSREHSRLHGFNRELRSRIKDLKSDLNDARDLNDPDKVAMLKKELASAVEMQNKTAMALHSLESPYSSKYESMEASIKGLSVYLDKGEFLEISDAAGAFLYDVVPVDEIDELADVTGSTKSSGSTKSDGSVFDGKYWMDLQRNDPEEFKNQIDELDTHDKQQVYSSIQEEIQSENRFWAMMTNTQQASHDTLKSIIGNFRV